MRTAFLFLVAVVAAHVNVAHSGHQLSNERDSLDSSENTQQDQLGFAFGSPRKQIVTYYNLHSGILGIPFLMQTTNNETVLRPKEIPTNASHVNMIGSHFGNETAWLNGFELSNYTYRPYGREGNDSRPKLSNFTLEAYGNYLEYVNVGLCLIGKPSVYDDIASSDVKEMSVLDSLLASGDIATRSFSLTVGTFFDGLFGEIDHGKYDGPLMKFKHYYEEAQDDDLTIHPTLLMDGMAGTNFSVYNPLVVQISKFWSLPDEYYDPLFDHFKQNYDMDDDGNIPCSILNSTEYVSFYFSGEEFQFPVTSFVYFTYDNISSYPYDGYSKYYTESDTCKLYIGQEMDGYVRISEALFHGRYLVVDYDNEEIAIARAATKSKPQTIETISTGIPRATPAKYSISISVSTDSDGWESYSTSFHPTYAMYTGGHFGFNSTDASYATETESSTLSTSAPSTTGGSTNHSTKIGSSSSSKAAGNTQTVGGVFAFITCFLGALMML